KAIRDCYTDGILVAGGGHAMAAGLTISATNIDQFREVLTEHLRHDIVIARRSRSLKFDGVAALSAASRDTVNALARAGPFGAGNPEPVFLFEDVVPLDTRPVGAGHLSLQLMDLSGASVRAIAFRAIGERLGDLLSSEARLHVLGKIRPDDWRGPMAAQIDIVDVAKA
ncbi:MAG: single-stranded-DNA-specific exonuclease RecJ, partial [Pseudomonadota bacterium]